VLGTANPEELVRGGENGPQKKTTWNSALPRLPLLLFVTTVACSGPGQIGSSPPTRALTKNVFVFTDGVPVIGWVSVALATFGVNGML
jgi:hypothetical protein